MKVQIKVQLDKPARSTGADRYVGHIKGEFESKHLDESFNIYIPQSISRSVTSGVTPAQEMMVTLEH